MEAIRKKNRTIDDVINYLISSKKEVQNESQKRFKSKEVLAALEKIRNLKIKN